MFCYTDVVHGPVLLAQKSGIYTFVNKFYDFTKWVALKFETYGRSKMVFYGILVDLSSPDLFQSDLFSWYLWKTIFWDQKGGVMRLLRKIMA